MHLLCVLVLLGTLPMKQIILGSSTVVLPTTSTFVDLLGGSGANSGTENIIKSVWRCPGVFRNLRITVTNGPGGSVVRSFTLRINGIATAMTCSMTGSTVEARYTSSDIVVAKNDRISFQFGVSGGTPAAAGNWSWSLEFEGDNASECGHAGAIGTFSATNVYAGVLTNGASSTALVHTLKNVVAAAGSITGVGIHCESVQGSGNGYDCYINKNGVRQDGTGGTVDTKVSIVNSTFAEATFSLPVVGGDILYYELVRTGSAVTRGYGIGCSFIATVDGQSNYCGGYSTTAQALTTGTQNRFHAPVQHGNQAWNASESGEYINPLAAISTFSLIGPRVVLSQAPGSGKSWEFSGRKNAADWPGSVLTISDLNTSGSTLASDSFVDGDRHSIRNVGVNTPASSTSAIWAFVMDLSEAEPDPGPADPVAGTGSLIEMCFGGSYRTWIKNRAAVRHWWLGDVGTTAATDDITERPQFGAFGTYENIPTKARGLLPEYGLANWFDGAVMRLSTLTGLSGTGGTFTLIALCRPHADGLGAAQCLYQTGGTGSAYLGLNSSNQPVFGVTGGTLIAATTALVAGGEYLIVGSYDGSVGQLFVGELVQGASVESAGPTALTFTADHDLGTIGANENTEYFTGAIQGVAELEEALEIDDVEALHATGIWTDVTPDVHGPLIIDRGIHDDGPLARLAATGTCTFALDNSHLNRVAIEGYYSPDHVNGRVGFREGIPVRVSLADQGSPSETPIQFIGRVRDIDVVPGIYLERSTKILAVDWMEEASRSKLKGLSVLSSVRADEVVAAILNAMRNRPHNIRLETGSDTYPRALHNTKDESTTAQQELLKVSQSEFGLIYLLGDGTLVHEARSSRASDADPEYTLTDFLNVEQKRSTEKNKNVVLVTVHPSRLGDDPVQVLHSTDAIGSPSDPAIRLDNGVDLELFLPFKDLTGEPNRRIGAVDLVTPVPTTDYLINTAEDGSGTNVTTNSLITVSFTLGGNGVYLRAQNQYGQRVWITYLQLRGRAVYDYEAVTLRSEDAQSIDEDGEQDVSIDMPYQSQPGVGQGAADFIRVVLSQRTTRIKRATLWADYSVTHQQAALYADISTRIQAGELMSGVDAEFLINGKRIEWNNSGETGRSDIDVTFTLTPASIYRFWTLDESALSETTTLGYL